MFVLDGWRGIQFGYTAPARFVDCWLCESFLETKPPVPQMEQETSRYESAFTVKYSFIASAALRKQIFPPVSVVEPSQSPGQGCDPVIAFCRVITAMQTKEHGQLRQSGGTILPIFS
jgi:hypothetical protein